MMKAGMTAALLLGAIATSGCNAERAGESAASEESADTLTHDGWRTIRIGMSLDELNTAVGTSLSLDGNTEYEQTNCTFLNVATEAGQPSVMYADGKVVRLSVFSPGTEATGGLKVGDPAAKVRDVFGDKVVTEPHKYDPAPAEYLTIWTKAPAGANDPDARGLRFEADADGAVTAMHAGTQMIEHMDGCS